MKKNKLVIFDYDGVIADSFFLWEEAFRIAGAKYSIPFSFNREFVNQLEHITMESVFNFAELTPEIRESLKYDVFGLFKKRSLEVKIFKGVAEIIRKIHQSGHIICINTANSGEVVGMRVESEGFGSCISDISGSEISGGKSEKIKALMKKHDFKTEDTFMIGDSLGDITEGKKAGVYTIGAGYGWQDPQLLKTAHPDYMCMTVADLGDLLEEII